MPFNWLDHRIAAKIARELRRLADLIEQIPLDRDAPSHKEMAVVLRQFERINAILKKTDAGIVTEAQKLRIGGHFENVGGALQKRSTVRRKR
jgi:aminoglycoside phosphotransferase family enzyme